MNISSIVVKTKAEAFEAVRESIQSIQGCEIYIADEASCQFIVVIEAKDSSDEIAINRHLQGLQGVISADMHYAYQEEELNAKLAAMDESGSLELINNDKINAKDMPYQGEVEYYLKQFDKGAKHD